MSTCRWLIAGLFVAWLSGGGNPITDRAGAHAAERSWSAKPLATLTGFNVPECALCDENSGLVYVSSIESSPGRYWSDDGKGHISVVGSDHRLKKSRWVESRPGAVLNGPKGMGLLGKHLYFADNKRLMRCSAATGANVEVVASGFNRANDVATDGTNVWVSDTAAGKVYCVVPGGRRREIPAPAGVNGITFFGKRMFAVSWAKHEVYELDPHGQQKPIAFGVARHFTNLDGIEVLGDGTFVVSDFTGNKVCTIGSDRTTVKTLAVITTPADIGINRKEQLLYVPQFMKDTLVVFRLTRNP